MQMNPLAPRIFGLAALLIPLGACRGDQDPTADLALTNATVVGVESGELLTARTILVDGTRIVRIGSPGAGQPSRGGGRG